MANRIWIELPRDRYRAGDVVAGALMVGSETEPKLQDLSLEVLGRESTVVCRGSDRPSRLVRTRHDRTEFFRIQVDHIAWRVPLPPAEVASPGLRRFPFEFQIPADALPSYAGSGAKIEYTLTARLDAPWWPDALCRVPLYVFYDRASVRTRAQPVAFRSDEDPEGRIPEFLVELDGDHFFAGETVACRLTVLHVRRFHVRGAYVELVGEEWAEAQGVENTGRQTLLTLAVPVKRVRVGVPIEFGVPLPEDLPSSYESEHSSYTHILRFGLDVAWAADLIAETAIVVVR